MSDPYLPEGWTQERIDDELVRQSTHDRDIVATCRACGAPMIWAEGPTGKPVPVNFDPDPKGNIVIDDHDGVLVAMYLKKGIPTPHVSVPRYTSHFATCPEAASFRKSS